MEDPNFKKLINEQFCKEIAKLEKKIENNKKFRDKDEYYISKEQNEVFPGVAYFEDIYSCCEYKKIYCKRKNYVDKHTKILRGDRDKKDLSKIQAS